MSVAEFYVDNCIDPDWDAPYGMDNFLRSHASEYSEGNNRKRGRDEYHEEEDVTMRPRRDGSATLPRGDAAEPSTRPPAKRVRRDEALVRFDAPFPCAFQRRGGGCRFRATCSYHHGVALPCNCDSPACPRGHAHRRAPRACDHGATFQCRWNTLGECSFHHGFAETCRCESTSCPRAHPTRVRRNAEARLERSRELARERPDLADRNARTLFLGRGPVDEAFFTESHIHEKFSHWIRTASLDKVEGDPIVGVKVDPEHKFAFIEFHKAELATLCLSELDNLELDGWGQVRLERPKVYDPSMAPSSVPSSVVSLNVDRLDHLTTQQSKAARGSKKKKKKGKASMSSKATLYRTWRKATLYRTWRKEQKALKAGQTNQQLRQSYLQLFPDRK